MRILDDFLARMTAWLSHRALRLRERMIEIWRVHRADDQMHWGASISPLARLLLRGINPCQTELQCWIGSHRGRCQKRPASPPPDAWHAEGNRFGSWVFGKKTMHMCPLAHSWRNIPVVHRDKIRKLMREWTCRRLTSSLAGIDSWEDDS